MFALSYIVHIAVFAVRHLCVFRNIISVSGFGYRNKLVPYLSMT